MTQVRTRFAPSPTGYMHIGGMRTALFNWLWARKNGGQFILRIDDTDKERNIDAAIEPILAAFRWLGLDWDEGPEVGGDHGPYYQSQRGDLYQAAIEQLLESGAAYRCYETPEQIQADRQAAEKAGEQYVSARRSLDLSEQEQEQNLSLGVPHVIRLLVPRDEKISITDHVRGEVTWDAGLMPDPVLMRANGSPLYNFATVVDDSQLEISHVIRAEEHLSNTPVQVLIYNALGKSIPEFAHIPFVTAPGTTRKLSKRDVEKYRNNPQFQKMFRAGDEVFSAIGLGDSASLNPVMVEYYDKIGYLPHAVFNTLARLGWSLDDKTEIMTRDKIVESFTLDRVVKKPAGLDPDKLNSFQQHWIAELTDDEKVERCLPYLTKAGLVTEPIDEATQDFVKRVIVAYGDRVKIYSDILSAACFFRDDVEYDAKAFKKRIAKESVPPLLTEFRERLQDVEDWSAEPLETALKSFAEEKEVSPGLLIHALRIAGTGQPQGPGLYDCLMLVGKEKLLERIDAALARV